MAFSNQFPHPMGRILFFQGQTVGKADPVSTKEADDEEPADGWVLKDDISAFGEYRDAGEISAIRWLYQLHTVDVDEGFLFSDLNPAVHDIMEMMHRRHDPDHTALHKS